MRMIVDASDLILGRLAAFSAKRALLGETVDIVNCEKALVSGNRRDILGKHLARKWRGQPGQGPNLPTRPELFVRRAIRGMLPYKTLRGKEALSRIICFRRVPKDFAGKKMESLKHASASISSDTRYISVGDICNATGWKK